MFQWNAEDYAKNSNAQATWAKELIAKLNLVGHESVLDVGCGDGKITAQIARIVKDGYILGIDSSQNMIDFASTQHSLFSNLQFVCMDARQIEVAREFDIVFSNATLHWLNDQLAFLQGAYKALKAGGRLIISCGGRGNAATFIEVFEQLKHESLWHPYLADFQPPVYFHDDRDYRAWLLEAGFQPVNVDLIPRDMVQQGRDGLAGWMRTTGMPYTRMIPESDREKFINALVDAYLNQYPLDRNGNAHLPMVRLEVNALKP